MEKENRGILIGIIVVLAILIIGLGWYILFGGEKTTSSDSDSKNPTQNNEESPTPQPVPDYEGPSIEEDSQGQDNQGSEQTTEESTKLTASEVKNLMKKYIVKSNGTYYLTDYSDEASKSAIAAGFAKASNTITCSKTFEGYADGSSYYVTEDESLNLPYCPNDKAKVYTYDRILSAKKQLFGPNATLSKKTFVGYMYLLTYIYQKSSNTFVALEKSGKGGGGTNVSEIYKYSETDEALVVKFKTGVKYNVEVEEQKSYQYRFTKEDGNYYLTSIKQIG